MSVYLFFIEDVMNKGVLMVYNAVSVAMAVYNGEKYICEQIDSIINQMKNGDELVISYNESSDDTWNIIQEYALKDEKVRIFKCEEKGVVANFENAITKCNNDVILLADQDDVWCDTKLDSVRISMNDKETTLVLHGKYVTDGELRIKKSVSVGSISTRFFSILLRNKYTGCCMAFRKSMLHYLLPFPRRILHDWWIALISSLYGKIEKLPEPLIYYRRHGENVSFESRRSVLLIVRDRIYALWYIFLRSSKVLIGKLHFKRGGKI